MTYQQFVGKTTQQIGLGQQNPEVFFGVNGITIKSLSSSIQTLLSALELHQVNLSARGLYRR